jgi:hypothetical protein
MKTTVMGVFPRQEDARRVLSQLVGSTLDLDAIRVLHRAPETQRQLAAEAGLPADRSVPAGIVAGALLGAAAGFGLGVTPGLPLAGAGPLFLGALGLLAGAAAGGLFSAMADALPVPRSQLPELADTVDRGATVVLVRTDSLPTARAIRDLFQASGSEILAPVGEGEEDVVTEIVSPPDLFVDTTVLTAAPPVAAAGDTVPDAHAPFVPPWRRLWRGSRPGDGEAASGAAGTANAAGPTEAPVAPWERPAPQDAEAVMYQPPEVADVAEDSAPRRGRKRAEAPEPPPDTDGS